MSFGYDRVCLLLTIGLRIVLVEMFRIGLAIWLVIFSGDPRIFFQDLFNFSKPFSSKSCSVPERYEKNY